MKTLIFNGSPRRGGDTDSLVTQVLNDLEGDHKVVYAYDNRIQPCIDCRYCWENHGCAIQDGMQEIYDYILECDNILIASPLYFSELSGPLLAVASRLQMFFCARHFRKTNLIQKTKKGGVIIVGGGDGSVDKAYSTASVLLRHMNCMTIGPCVTSHNTNIQGAKDDKNATSGCGALAGFFNSAR